MTLVLCMNLISLYSFFIPSNAEPTAATGGGQLPSSTVGADVDISQCSFVTPAPVEMHPQPQHTTEDLPQAVSAPPPSFAPPNLAMQQPPPHFAAPPPPSIAAPPELSVAAPPPLRVVAPPPQSVAAPSPTPLPHYQYLRSPVATAQDWEMSYSDLSLREAVGWGNFGIVVLGSLLEGKDTSEGGPSSEPGKGNRKLVAVKRLKGGWEISDKRMSCNCNVILWSFASHAICSYIEDAIATTQYMLGACITQMPLA